VRKYKRVWFSLLEMALLSPCFAPRPIPPFPIVEDVSEEEVYSSSKFFYAPVLLCDERSEERGEERSELRGLTYYIQQNQAARCLRSSPPSPPSKLLTPPPAAERLYFLTALRGSGSLSLGFIFQVLAVDSKAETSMQYVRSVASSCHERSEERGKERSNERKVVIYCAVEVYSRRFAQRPFSPSSTLPKGGARRGGVEGRGPREAARGKATIESLLVV